MSRNIEKKKKRPPRLRSLDSSEFMLSGVDETAIRREKATARELRKSQWWRNKTARGICHYCGGHFSPEELTMDHIVPLARGGKSVKNNLVPCCGKCNAEKKIMLPVEWDAP